MIACADDAAGLLKGFHPNLGVNENIPRPCTPFAELTHGQMWGGVPPDYLSILIRNLGLLRSTKANHFDWMLHHITSARPQCNFTEADLGFHRRSEIRIPSRQRELLRGHVPGPRADRPPERFILAEKQRG